MKTPDRRLSLVTILDRMSRSEKAVVTPYGPYTISLYGRRIMSDQSIGARTNEQETHAVEYRDVPGFPGYRIGSDGSVWGHWHGDLSRPLRQLKVGWSSRHGGKPGYPYVSLFRNGKRHQLAVHTILLLAFVGPRPEGMECCHEDDDPNNNSLDNIYWGTRFDNQADRRQNVRSYAGAGNPNATLSESDVRVIRRLVLNPTRTLAGIGRQFGVSETAIAYIRDGKSWKGLAS
jgi:hypothetical protein